MVGLSSDSYWILEPVNGGLNEILLPYSASVSRPSTGRFSTASGTAPPDALPLLQRHEGDRDVESSPHSSSNFALLKGAQGVFRAGCETVVEGAEGPPVVEGAVVGGGDVDVLLSSIETWGFESLPDGAGRNRAGGGAGGAPSSKG